MLQNCNCPVLEKPSENTQLSFPNVFNILSESPWDGTTCAFATLVWVHFPLPTTHSSAYGMFIGLAIVIEEVVYK